MRSLYTRREQSSPSQFALSRSHGSLPTSTMSRLAVATTDALVVLEARRELPARLDLFALGVERREFAFANVGRAGSHCGGRTRRLEDRPGAAGRTQLRGINRSHNSAGRDRECSYPPQPRNSTCRAYFTANRGVMSGLGTFFRYTRVLFADIAVKSALADAVLTPPVHQTG